MKNSILRAIAFIAIAVPGLAAAQSSYVNTEPYVVDPARYPYTIYPSSYELNDNYPWLTDTYPFDPFWSYSAPEQEAIIADEAALTNAEVLYDWTDGSRVLDIDQATIPEANQHNVPPPDENAPSADPLPETATVFQKNFTRTEKFGNKVFGAGYGVKASIIATTATATATKKVEAEAEGKVFGTAFSFEKDIIRARAYISGQEGGTNSGTAAVYVMGSEIWSNPLSYTFDKTPVDWNVIFFEAKQHFTVGPVPMSATASMGGGAKLSVKGEISPVLARLTLTPGGYTKANLSVAVDIIILALGVQGSLTSIDVSVPSSGELLWQVCQLAWKLKSDLKLNTLSGSLSLWAKVRFLFFSESYSVTIAKWPGITRTVPLLTRNGSQKLGICG